MKLSPSTIASRTPSVRLQLIAASLERRLELRQRRARLLAVARSCADQLADVDAELHALEADVGGMPS